MNRKNPALPTGISARLSVPAELVFDYELRKPPATPRELVVLIHGFQDRGARMFQKLEPCLPADALVLAPNAPFPLPCKTDDGTYKMNYSWYFYNPSTDEYFIDMKIAVEFLSAGLERLGLGLLPKRLIGFSQGGYLAPIAAQRLGNVKQVIGIGCDYLVDEISGSISFRVDGVHGSADDIVDPANAEKNHARLKNERGVDGIFSLLAGTGHRIDGQVQAKVRELVRLSS